jgi:hypothetical protein
MMLGDKRILDSFGSKVWLLFVLISLGPQVARAQATAEAAAETANSGTAASSVKNAKAPSVDTEKAASSHLVAPSGPPVDEANRKALEEKAGPDAGKLMLHSVPSGAQIFINGLFIGRTPLLLVVPPGKYKLEMRGQRQDYGKRNIGLLPRETQDIIVTLGSLYPGRVSTR